MRPLGSFRTAPHPLQTVTDVEKTAELLATPVEIVDVCRLPHLHPLLLRATRARPLPRSGAHIKACIHCSLRRAREGLPAHAPPAPFLVRPRGRLARPLPLGASAQVRVCGCDVRAATHDSLRRLVSCVSQDTVSLPAVRRALAALGSTSWLAATARTPRLDAQSTRSAECAFRDRALTTASRLLQVLFNQSVRYNICYGATHATDEELRAACATAQLDDFIGRLEARVSTRSWASVGSA